jgi:RNA polymerase sigma factor (sigma-70 family)
MSRGAGPAAELSDFDTFYRDHFDAMRRLGHLLIGSRAMGEELAQDAFLVLHGRWDEVESPVAFVRATMANTARSHWRRRAIERRHGWRLPRGDEVALPPELDECWQAIKSLPPADRSVVVLRFYADLSIGEISSLLALPEGTVKARLHRALKKLGRRLR